MTNPFQGANSSTYYVEELTPGVTPTSPVWTKLRNTGGIPAITKDTLQSAELDESREIKSIRTGNESAAADFSTELSFGSHDDLYANAMSSDWVAGVQTGSLNITVDSSLKTYTRDVGDFISDGFEVGDLVSFPALSGNNSSPFIATAVSALVITGGAILLPLTDETAATLSYSGDKLGTGNLCKTVSLLTHLKGKCGTVDKYILTNGVEMTGWSLEVAVNAQVTGSFPAIGRAQTIDVIPPAGSTFNPDNTNRPYTGVDGKILYDNEVAGGVTSITYTNDNNASPQFVIGSKAVSFVERGTANNSISASAFMSDETDLDNFLNEVIVNISTILIHPDGGSMSFTVPQTVLTAATPELGEGSVTIGIEGIGIGDSNNSSVVIQRLA
ncbi:phage tail tube protein [bacterium]|nr:phage tail tube protein [bacterium]